MERDIVIRGRRTVLVIPGDHIKVTWIIGLHVNVKIYVIIMSYRIYQTMVTRI